MNNPFKKAPLTEEEASRREEARKSQEEMRAMRQAEHNAREEELQQTRQQSIHNYRLEQARHAVPASEKAKQAAGKTSNAVISMFGHVQKADKRNTFSSRRIRHKRGTTKVYVEGSSPVPQPQAFDNRFASLFETKPMSFSMGTGRDFGKLTDAKHVIRRRRW
jgi:hypothetical protein